MADAGGKFKRNQREEVIYLPKQPAVEEMKELEPEHRPGRAAYGKKSQFGGKRFTKNNE